MTKNLNDLTPGLYIEMDESPPLLVQMSSDQVGLSADLKRLVVSVNGQSVPFTVDANSGISFGPTGGWRDGDVFEFMYVNAPKEDENV